MAGHELDAEKLGLERDPQRPPVSRQRLESRFNVARFVLFCLGLIALRAGLAVSKLAREEPQHSAAAGAGLQLKVEHKVERNEDLFVLTWNKESDAVRNAQRATLTITEGDHTEDVDLDLGTLRGGSAVYTPLATNVAFRLTVVSQKGETTFGTVRIVLEHLTPHLPPVPTL
jgi:hypothetical protein